jgi:hypothetical protein
MVALDRRAYWDSRRYQRKHPTPHQSRLTSPDIAGVPDADRAPADSGSEHHAGALSAQESDENVTFTALPVINVSSILLAAK